jgi:hypothetical protein
VTIVLTNFQNNLFFLSLEQEIIISILKVCPYTLIKKRSYCVCKSRFDSPELSLTKFLLKSNKLLGILKKTFSSA